MAIRKFRGDYDVTVNCFLLGWYRCKWCAFFPKGKWRKNQSISTFRYQSFAKVLVKDEDEKNRLLAAGNDFNFVTNVGDIIRLHYFTIVVELRAY